MKADKIRDYDHTELATETRDVEEKIFRLRFQLGMGQLEGLKKYRTLRKDRARMLTIQRERDLHPELEPAAKEKKKGK